MTLSREESRALAFIGALILLSLLGRWADRPQPLRGDLAAVNLDSLEAASAAALAKKSEPKKKGTGSKPPSAARPPIATIPVTDRTNETVRPMSINTATAEELQQIPGIGPVLAARIVAYRDSAGHFASLDALVAVKGVGPAMLERLRPFARAP